jgi:catechol 2,3-dioxygenase-like lactoylglutathione lyase family enzyme
MINMEDAPPTQRLQLALNVTNLEDSIAFYTKLFGTEPARLRPGYANFAIANPPLKLVLFEGGEDGTINHLGVEVATSEEVIAAEQRLIQAGLETTGIDDTVCCYAEKTETWLQGPDAIRWEYYVRTGDSEQMHNEVLGSNGATMCCAPEASAAHVVNTSGQ